MPKQPDSLSSFKISDMRRPEVRSLKKSAQEDPPAEESVSVGFPAVEQRLEGGTIDDLADELRGSYEKLEEMLETADIKKKAAAKKALAAYERTADLFEYLFQTKSALSDGGNNS